MSKASLKRLNEPSKFTREVLAEVTDDRYDDAVYVLLHSYAAREVFALMQDEMHCGDDRSIMAFASALEAISCEVAHRAHGERRTAVSTFCFEKLAKELHRPAEHDVYGDTHIRTIVGWWTI